MATMEITTKIGCKNWCDYCPQDLLVRRYKKRSAHYEMDLTLFKECVDKIPFDVMIHFSGMAEPWLNPACTQMVLYATGKGFPVSVYTTLVGMELNDIAQMGNLPFGKFEVHLPDGAGHTRIVVDDAYLLKLKTIMMGNIANLSFMTIGALHPRLREVIAPEKVVCHPVIDRAGNVQGIEKAITQPRLQGIIRCKSCGDRLNHNVLLPNGDVLLCCMDYGMEHVLGNLVVGSYAELFSGDTFRVLQHSLNDNTKEVLCRHCHNAKHSRLNWFPFNQTIVKGFQASPFSQR